MRIFMMTVLLCVYATRMSAQSGIAASPMQLSFDAAPGSSQTQIVTLSNPGDIPITMIAGFSDWYRDSTGSISYSAPSTLPSSCSGWLKIFPASQIVLGPQEKKEVTVMINLPPGAPAMSTNSMLLFTQLNKQEVTNKQGIVINLAVRIGVQIYNVPQGVHKKEIEIDQFMDSLITKGEVTEKQLFLRLRNSGQVSAEGKASVELTNMGTGSKTTLPLIMFYTLPGAVRQIKIPLSATLPPGRYSAVALVDYGEDQELRIGQLEFTQTAKNVK
jgi:P pilus assembly chaperone PapD